MLAIKTARSAATCVAAVFLACASPDSAPSDLSSASYGLGSPDLWVQTVNAPPSALPNSTIQLPVTVCNAGSASGDAPLRVLRSTDATITLTDTTAGSASSVGLLAPGACGTTTVAANMPGGNSTFFLGAYVDPTNVLVESNESNNATAAAASTAVGNKPDFIITSVSGPSMALPGSTFSTTVTLCNQGTTSGTAPVTVYLSADATITTGDIQIGTLSAPPTLAAGACATVTGNVTATSTSNTYYLGAIADRANAVNELVETNNSAAGNQIIVASKPDFAVTSVSGPATAVVGASISATATLCNQGTTAGTAPVTIYLSADATITTGDTQAGVLSAPPSLAPGACTTVTGNVTATSIAGIYYVGAIADAANGVAELNETNNARSGNQITVVSQPDFIVTAVSGPATAVVGTSFSATATLCNQGTTSGTAPIAIYLSADATITTSDIQAGVLSAPPSLAPGACATVTGNVTATSAAGIYQVGAIADAANGVLELNETNNAQAGNQLAVVSQPDFIVTAVSGPTMSALSGTFSATATICNQGTTSGTAPVAIYLSADATITTGDFQAGVLPAPPSLAPGACATVTGNVTAASTANIYFLGAIADAANGVAELNETNNAQAGNRISVGDAPDFVVTAVSAPAAALPNSQVTVVVTACNQGTQSGYTSLTIYFSPDDAITTADAFAGDLPMGMFLKPGECDVASGQVPAPGSPGTQYAGAIADSGNNTVELWEDDNAKAGNRVAVGVGPDLVISSASTSPSALPGAQLTVAATVCNQGTQAASSQATVYFSTDATITTDDLPAGDLPLSSLLQPGECETGSLTVPAPPAGTYTVGAIADRYAAQSELFEDNNAAAGNRVAVGSGPDFVVSSVSAASSALPNGSVQVTATVCNRGTLGAGAPAVEVFFSTDNTITAADFLGGPLPPAGFLDAGACATVAGNLPVPGTAGAYYAGTITDRSGSVAELLEDNNATAGNRVAVGNGPDLVVSPVTTAVAASPGSQVQVTATVCNRGTQGAIAPLDIYFSTDTFISNNDYYSASLPAPYLNPGECATVAGNAQVPWQNGTYYVGAIADGFGNVPELLEDNNAALGNRVGVGDRPDYYVKSVSTVANAQPGAPITVTATVCNQGTQIGSPTVNVYFSPDTAITTTDYFFAPMPPIWQLRPGACEVVSWDSSAPPPGTWYVGAIADPFNYETELFEDNNALAGNRMGAGNGPDFIISSVSTVASALPGGAVHASATVCNQGTQGAAAPVVEAFFSTDATITGSDFPGGPFPPAPFLDPGACATLENDVPLPPSAGTYYVGAIADRFNSTAELFEDNNATAGNRVAAGDGPDFVVSSVSTASPSATSYGSAQVTATVCNRGTRGAGAPEVEVFFSTDTTITTSDLYAGQLSPPGYLEAGACSTVTGTVPVPGVSGTYYAGAIADPFGYVTELLEDNNATAGNRVGIGNAPDFVIASISTAPTVASGGQLLATVTVCNQGTLAGSMPLDIYFSTDTFISINDFFSSYAPAPYLEPGACGTVEQYVQAPWQSGTYYIGGIIDSWGGIPELFKDNNTRAGNRVGVGDRPDYYVKSVSTVASAQPGAPITVTATVCNQGTQLGSPTVNVYFSPDATITTADYFFAPMPPIWQLRPGACEVVSWDSPAPPPGTWYVGAVADPYNYETELFEDNNALAGGRLGSGNGPDFVISSVTTAPSALPGSPVTVTATLCNQGTQGGSTAVDLFFSADATITGADLQAWWFPPSAYLQPGDCETKTATIGTPGSGAYYVGAIADQSNSMAELREDNNATAGNRLVVGYQPDFVITSVSTAPSAVPGATVTVTATLCNQGTLGASAPTIEAFFSKDATITGGDFFGGPLFPGGYLEAGACTTVTGTAQTPYPSPDPTAIYYAGAIVDRLGSVSELNEDNNATAGSRIGVGYASDFVISSISSAPTVASGGQLLVAVTVCNQGTLAGPMPLDVYFSTDTFISINDWFSSYVPAPYLEPGACGTVEQYVQAPWQSGTYYIGGIIDSWGGIPELFKDNNTRAGNRVGVGDRPDYYVKSVSTVAGAQPGAPITVTTTVCNQGTQLGSPTVNVYFSPDATITTADYFFAPMPPIWQLRPGACEVVSWTSPAPPPGTWYAGAIVDPFNYETELFEDNNALAGNRVGVGSAPDFVVSSVTTASGAAPGSQVTVTSTLCNQGTQGGSSMVELFFSNDATITGTDQVFWTFPAMTYLQPGECTTQSKTGSAPPMGTSYVGAIADRFNSTTELLEDNNTTVGNRLVVGYGPDFVVTSVSTVPGAMPGATVMVTATVCNQGSWGGFVPRLEAYFSKDATITTGDFSAGLIQPPGYLEAGACATETGPAQTPYPSPGPTGTYYVGAIVDPMQWVTELNEDNNATAGNQVGIGSAPDFVISSISSAPTVASGGQLLVAVTVCNQGTLAGPMPLDVYFSTDTFISINDWFSTYVPAPYLEPGACGTVEQYVQAPWQSGTYYIGGIIDSWGGIPELFKDNNTRAGNRVGVGDRPDYYVKSVSTVAGAQPGAPITVTATVCNQGTQIGSPTVNVYFSPDATITTADYFFAPMPPIWQLRPGACEVVSWASPAPPPGTWYVGAIADPFNYETELFEDNNALAGNRVGVGNAPDFIISSVSLAPNSLPGSPLDVTATICNQGTVSGTSQVDLLLSTDTTIAPPTDLIIGSFQPPASIEPGSCFTQTVTSVTPPSGTYYVGAVADWFNWTQELLEDNNTTVRGPLVVGTGPDFVVTSVSTAPSIMPGTMATVSATLCNQGTQGAGAPMVELFFSKDATITGGDFFGGPFSPAGYLEAGSCATVTGTGPAPYPSPDPKGTYYVGAIVDRQGSVPELREDNNATAGNQVGVGNAPDFVISSISTGPTVTSGGQLLATVTVCNQGTQAGPMPLDIYFSTDDFISINDWFSTYLPAPFLEPGACGTVEQYVQAPWQSGTYYIGAIIDSWGGIPELFKDNNTRAGNRVGVGDRPDYYVKSVSSAPSAQPGAPITVMATVCNQGTQIGSPMGVVLFSADASMSLFTDYWAGTLPPIQQLRPGACEVVTQAFFGPPPGTWYVGAIVDPFNNETELFEDNNAKAGTEIGVGSAPDFVVSQVTTAPSVAPGGQVALSVTLCNQGTQPGGTSVDLFFSADDAIAGTDQLAWHFPPGPSLQPGGCATQTANAPAPPVGTWYVGAIADRAPNSIAELLEDNNTAVGNRVAVGDGPDFIVTSVSTSAPSAMPGANVTVSARVCNQGNQGAGAPMVEIFFSKDATITGSDFFSGPLPPPGFLAAGACATVTGTGPAPSPSPDPMRTYYVGAIVDRMGSVLELREDNNAAAGNRVGVGNAPDFVISSISTGPSAPTGGQLLVTVTVCNQGTQAGPMPLDIYFSTDTFISINDWLSTYVPAPSLEPGACGTVQQSVPAPWQSGTYYVGGIIDSWGGIPELFKDNNTAATATPVAVGP